MNPLSNSFGKNSVYWGERGHWLLAFTRNCSEGLSSESNWFSFLKRLGIDNPNAGSNGSEQLTPTIAIEEASFSGDGWIQYLIIDPIDAVSVKIAEEAKKDMENYPFLDESDFTEREDNYYYENFRDYGKREIAGLLRGRDDVSETDMDFVLNHVKTEALQEWFEGCIPSGEYHSEGYPNFKMVDAFSDEDIRQLLDAFKTSVPN